MDKSKDLRGLLKSIIRLRLIVIGAPAALGPVSGQYQETSGKALADSTNRQWGMGLTTLLSPTINVGSIPRCLISAALRVVCGRQ